MSDRKTAIVTGGSRGIGRAISVELARAGYYIIVNYNSNKEAAEETLGLMRGTGGDGEIIKFDVGDTDEVKRCIDEIFTRHKEIEVLVNNAGIIADNLFLMTSAADWKNVINTNLNGFYNVTKPVLRKMIKKRRGSIVTISSIAGLAGNRGQANYAASKAGLIAASKTIAVEVARMGVRVNVVAPGLINTEMIKDAPVDIIKEMIPMQRPGEPAEVAKVVRFLCSPDASYVTGQVISVNGGMY